MVGRFDQLLLHLSALRAARVAIGMQRKRRAASISDLHRAERLLLWLAEAVVLSLTSSSFPVLRCVSDRAGVCEL